MKTCFHKKCGVFEACKKVKDFFDTLKPTAYLSCRFSFFFRYKDSKLVTKFELEPAQAEQAADAGRKAAGLRKFESCIVHHS